MKYQRSVAIAIAAWLFLPPLVFSSSTVRAQAQPAAAEIVAPKIQRFDIDAPNNLLPGEALIFRITGTPRSSASVSIAGVEKKVALREVMAGIYEGAYTIKKDDQLDVDAVVTGHLRRGNQEIATILGQPLVDVSALAGIR